MNWAEAFVTVASLVVVAVSLITVNRARSTVARAEELRASDPAAGYQRVVVGLAISDVGMGLAHKPGDQVMADLTPTGAVMRPGSTALVDYPGGHSYVGEVGDSGTYVTWTAKHQGEFRLLRIGGDWRWA